LDDKERKSTLNHPKTQNCFLLFVEDPCLVKDVQTQCAVVDAETLQSPGDGQTWVFPRDEWGIFLAIILW
jgi:hypothetical protein